MALVDYASSDGDEEDIQLTIDPKVPDLKRKSDDENSPKLPPLPSEFHDLYASTTRVSTRDDPALHGGRKRATPHVEGNWPTHLYIEWYPAAAENESLTKLIAQLEESISPKKDTVNSLLTSDLGAPLPLHISLSRPIVLQTDRKDAFVTTLEISVKSSGIRPFNVGIAGLDWVPNFEKTRWFLVLRLQKPELNGLNKLLYVSNKVVQEYDQPTLYTQVPDFKDEIVRRTITAGMKGNAMGRRRSEAKIDWSGMEEVSDAFHISIAWTLKRPGSELLALTKAMTIDGFEDVREITLRVGEMKAKVGNIVTSHPLPRKAIEEKALWGD